jgi:hypothetical protein
MAPANTSPLLKKGAPVTSASARFYRRMIARRRYWRTKGRAEEPAPGRFRRLRARTRLHRRDACPINTGGP